MKVLPILLWSFLASGPMSDLSAAEIFHRPFQDITLSDEDYVHLLADILKKEKPDVSDARGLMELARQYRERFGRNPWEQGSLKGMLSCRRVRALALICWFAKDENLTYHMMREGFLGQPADLELDAWFAAFAACGGMMEHALQDLEAAQKWLPAEVVANKRSFLLRATGRNGDARLRLNPGEISSIPMEMAVETGAWEEGIKASVAATADSPKYQNLRQLIAILSQDPVLMDRYRASGNPGVALAAGDPASYARLELSGTPRAYELRELAQDALLSATLETKLTQALSNGMPVRFDDMVEYFQQPDLLPNRERAVQLAIALGASPRCERNPGGGSSLDPAWFPTGAHRILAANALLDLGHGDASYRAIRPFLEELGDASAYPVESWGGYSNCLTEAYRRLGTIAALTWPEASHVERLERLSVVMTVPDVNERAKKFFDLVRDRASDVSAHDAAVALFIPLHDLSCGKEVPAEARESARQLLELFHPTDTDRRLIESWSMSGFLLRTWKKENLTLALEKPLPEKVVLKPRGFGDIIADFIPGQWDPVLPEFVTVDGLNGVRMLNDRKIREYPESLMRSIVMRLCLDWKLAEEKTSVSLGDHRFNVSPQELVLLCSTAWDFPPEWLDRYSRACWQPDPEYFAQMRPRFAAMAYAKAGRFEEAAVLARIATLREISWLPEFWRTSQLFQYEALAAIKRGNLEAMQRGFRKCMALAPYRPEIAARILAESAGLDPAVVAKRLNQAIDAFWDAKRIEVPESQNYDVARSMWKKACAVPPEK